VKKPHVGDFYHIIPLIIVFLALINGNRW